MKNDNIGSSLVFWNTAKEFLYHHLPDIRKISPNTSTAYRNSLNQYTDYLEQQKKHARKNISFEDFSRDNIKEYIDWMLNRRSLAPKTCNLRLTAIHSLLEYASNEYPELMAIYLSACSVKGVKAPDRQIEFFEPPQMKAILSAPDIIKKTERRNQMMLILLYDTAARVSELLQLRVDSLHLDSAVPYVMVFGKGRKYRNIPLMGKTQKHLERYLKEFHSPLQSDTPLFYTTTYGEKHRLSADTMEVMLKRYVVKCIQSGIEMPPKYHCHMVRKTRAMDLYQNDVPLTHIQQLLGHENLSTTSGFYAFATLDTLAKSIRKVSPDTTKIKWADKDVLAKLYHL